VLRGTKDLVQCPLLDEVAEVHHSGAVTLLVYGAEIVRDEKVGSAEFAIDRLVNLACRYAQAAFGIKLCSVAPSPSAKETHPVF
jgi:hypothetical protein